MDDRTYSKISLVFFGWNNHIDNRLLEVKDEQKWNTLHNRADHADTEEHEGHGQRRNTQQGMLQWIRYTGCFGTDIQPGNQP